MAMSASLKRRIDDFVRRYNFDSFVIEDGEIIMYDDGEPFSMREFRRNSETHKAWAELQSDYESEN